MLMIWQKEGKGKGLKVHRFALFDKYVASFFLKKTVSTHNSEYVCFFFKKIINLLP